MRSKNILVFCPIWKKKLGRLDAVKKKLYKKELKEEFFFMYSELILFQKIQFKILILKKNGTISKQKSKEKNTIH